MKRKNKIFIIFILVFCLFLLINNKTFAVTSTLEIVDSEDNRYVLPDVVTPENPSWNDYTYFFYYDTNEQCYFLGITTNPTNYFVVRDFNNKFAYDCYDSENNAVTFTGYKYSLSNGSFVKTDRSGYYGVSFFKTDTVYAYCGNIVDNTESQVFPQPEEGQPADFKTLMETTSMIATETVTTTILETISKILPTVVGLVALLTGCLLLFAFLRKS